MQGPCYDAGRKTTEIERKPTHPAHARPLRHPADDATQYAVSVDGLPDRLPAFARHRRGAGRPGAGAGPAAVFARWAAGDPRMHRGPAEAQAHAGGQVLRRAVRALSRHHRAGGGLPAGARSQHRRIASPGATSCPKGRASTRSMSTSIDDEDGGDPLAWAFGALGVQDRARHFATLYLNDVADVLRDAVDPRFEFVRYAESLAQSQPTFDPLAAALAAPLNLVDQHPARTDAGGRGAACADARAGVGALPRQRLCARSASRRRSRRTTRLSSPCWAAASSTPNCANSASRACSTISTTSRSTTASGRCWRCSNICAANAAQAQLVRTFVRSR